MIKRMPANKEDTRGESSIPRLGRVSEGGNGNPFQYS